MSRMTHIVIQPESYRLAGSSMCFILKELNCLAISSTWKGYIKHAHACSRK